MDVFISWSGERSRAAAEALRDWLPMVINAVEPWLSSADIDKGSRWAAELSARLEISTAGIVCLTPSNLRAEWILFEAGALSKTIKNTLVCPLLIDLKPTDVKGPLAQFQAVKANDKKELWGLVQTLNNAQEKGLPEKNLGAAFEMWWPTLNSHLQKLPLEKSGVSAQRSERELLEELLGLVRNQGRSLSTDSLNLSDEDRKEIIEGRIARAVRSIDPSAGGVISTGISGKNINMTLDGKKKYSVTMPVDVNLDDVVARTLAQIQEQNT